MARDYGNLPEISQWELKNPYVISNLANTILLLAIRGIKHSGDVTRGY
jgi:hypothetical protein